MKPRPYAHEETSRASRNAPQGWTGRIGWMVLCWALAAPAHAVEAGSKPEHAQTPIVDSSLWHYGAYLDVAYILNANFPENHLWRNRATAARHNEFAPNMALAYVRKEMNGSSRWGMELGVQGGYDSQNFAFVPGEREVGGADTLRHLHRANISYLAPVGKGLAITVGLFNSLIGFESLYAKDNLNYTRSWIADNTPYMMFGVNAKYPVSDHLTVTAFIVNGYFHLSHPNDQPSYGGQWTYKTTSRLTLTQTLYGGPDQTNTAVEYWRFYANHIVEWKGDDLIIAASYDIGTENISNRPGSPRAFVTGGDVVARWHVVGPWTVALRPEFYWDRNGRWTGSEQFVKAVTSTVEYRISYKWTNTIVRLEHRWDESTGAGGGFFRRGEIQPGVIGLSSTQHLVLLGILWTFDSP